MAERPDEEQHDQDTSSATGSDDDSINDPLTQTDADAPQKPFGAGGQSAGSDDEPTSSVRRRRYRSA